jgi:hypothetical protein
MGDYGVGFAGVGTHGFAVDEARGEASGGVEKDGEFTAAERLGEFGSPLLGGVDRDLRAGKLIAEQASELEGDGIVTAKGVAAGEDKGAGHEERLVSSRMWPSEARSWMWRGTWPSAWVEQLRHGSKPQISSRKDSMVFLNQQSVFRVRDMVGSLRPNEQGPRTG